MPKIEILQKIKDSFWGLNEWCLANTDLDLQLEEDAMKELLDAFTDLLMSCEEDELGLDLSKEVIALTDMACLCKRF